MDRRQFLTSATLGGLATVLAGCTGAATSNRDPSSPPPPGTAEARASDTSGPAVEVIAAGLNVPWAIAFLADGSALVTQRDDATVLRVSPDGQTRTVGSVADAAPRGEGGLQGVAVAPDDESAVFLYYTTASDNRLVRMDFDGDRLTNPTPLITGLDTAFNHHGGAVVFDDEGSLFVAVGDAAQPQVAQDIGALNGKILRVDQEGRPWPGNPFDNEVWSLGHRNVEGLAFDGEGRLWASEFGQDRRDELNLIRRGGNYGWPEFEGESDDPRYVSPAVIWDPDAASPAGLAVVGATAYMAALRGRRLWQIPLDGESAGEPVALFTDTFGRIRAVAAAPDGSLWIGTSNTDGRGRPAPDDDRLIRVRPQA